MIKEEEAAQEYTLKTHTKINNQLVGYIQELKTGYAKTILKTTRDMIVDTNYLIHNGFIFTAAEYAAIAAVNEKNSITTKSNVNFYVPVKLGEIITFEAQSKYEEARKREIKVIGTLNEIKIFEGIFQIIVLEEHILTKPLKVNS